MKTERVATTFTAKVTGIALQAGFIAAVIWLPGIPSAQPSPHDWYVVRVERQFAVQVITFSTDDGPVRVTLPEHIVSGERFYGTVELPPEGAGGADAYVLGFSSGQSVHADAQRFSWQAPKVAVDTDVQLLVSDFRNVRVAQVAVTVEAGPTAGEISAELYIPKTVQGGRTVVVSGAFDGTGANVSLTLGNTPAQLVVQTSRRSVFLIPPRLIGNTTYTFIQNGRTQTGTVRCVTIEERIGATSLRNGARAPYHLVVRGLQGIDHEVAIAFRNLTPTLVSFPAETIVIQPSSVRRDGTFTIDRILSGIQPGEIRIVASMSMLIPTTVEDEVGLVLKMPRQHSSSLPGQEHADMLRQRYGERAMPLLQRLLDDQPDFGEAAEAMLSLDVDAAAKGIFNAIGRRPKYDWDFALAWYMKKIRQDARYPFRDALHTAAAQIIEAAPTETAVQALVLTGSSEDVPLL